MFKSAGSVRVELQVLALLRQKVAAVYVCSAMFFAVQRGVRVHTCLGVPVYIAVPVVLEYVHFPPIVFVFCFALEVQLCPINCQC